MLNAFTIDVEDGISLAMRDRFGKQVPQTRRVVELTLKILELLEQTGNRATFFILGQVAEVFPFLVKEISDAGHEIGVHGYEHIIFDRLNPRTANQELKKAKKLLEDISGNIVRGHRAPCFSIGPKTDWALDVLLEVGFEYDSSIMPGRGFGYGWPDQSMEIGPLKTPGGQEILEVPLTVVRLGGIKVPALGGSYFRLLPYGVSRRLMKSVTKHRPAVVYLHPYELDAEAYPDYYFKELKKSSLSTQLRMRSFWLRRKSMTERYSKLLSDFRFTSIETLLARDSLALEAEIDRCVEQKIAPKHP